MALGLTYDQAAGRAGEAFMHLLQESGCSYPMETALLKAFGLKSDVDYVERTYSPHWGSMAYTKNLLWGRRALVTVRSKNIADGMHMLYWDGEKVWDPRQADKKRYEDWAEVEPLNFTLFREGKPT